MQGTRPQVEVSKRRLVGSGGAAPAACRRAAAIRTTSSANSPATTAAPTTPIRRGAARAADGMWKEEGEISGGGWTPHGGAPGDTYRTVCVRLCDGYYFPISFSTLPSHFAAGRRSLHLEVRGTGRTLLPSEPRRDDGAGRGAAVERALHQAQDRLPLPQGIRQRLLVQGGRIPARPRRSEGETPPAMKRPAPPAARIDRDDGRRLADGSRPAGRIAAGLAEPYLARRMTRSSADTRVWKPADLRSAGFAFQRDRRHITVISGDQRGATPPP